MESWPLQGSQPAPCLPTYRKGNVLYQTHSLPAVKPNRQVNGPLTLEPLFCEAQFTPEPLTQYGDIVLNLEECLLVALT